MGETIDRRTLRDDTAEIMRRVAAGESLVVMSGGHPVADLVPHRARRTLAEVQEAFRALPPMHSSEWRRERDADDVVFGPDDPGRPGHHR
ncbi:type II toxin-antitoxin system prevent-host-death family antitoxin [Amycolatopsis jejuensis]|uniref:type II toxin-antitoxin system Phd/YefM family antitoxin n=1 Tax=Amycolatopsis jejuensis TaxID=330084 RepID=UPI000AD4DA7B